MAFAKIQEQKLALKHNPPKRFSPYLPLLPTPFNNQTSTPSTYVKLIHTTNPNLPNSNRLNNHNTNSQPKTTIQKLSQSQIQAKREKGLCLYCDEKYIVGHKCKASAHILIILDSEVLNLEEDVDSDELCSSNEISERIDTPQISLYAMSGVLMPQTLKFKGSIGRLNVNILIDRGSTHNFLQSRVVSLLNLQVTNRK